jgi:hypothetical protein
MLQLHPTLSLTIRLLVGLLLALQVYLGNILLRGRLLALWGLFLLPQNAKHSFSLGTLWIEVERTSFQWAQPRRALAPGLWGFEFSQLLGRRILIILIGIINRDVPPVPLRGICYAFRVIPVQF